MKKFAIASILIITILILALAVLSAGFWYPGITPNQTARIIVHDHKFGSRAKGAAIFFGDAFVHALKRESENYRLVNTRNAFWIADILSQKETDISHAAAVELYGNDNLSSRLAGAAVLAKYGDLGIHEFSPEGLIHRILDNPQTFEENENSLRDSEYVELALKVTVNANARQMIPQIMGILKQRASPYWAHAIACDALAALNAKSAIPLLVESLQSEDFFALPNAFKALTRLGEDKAVPLAIARLGPEIEGKNSEILVDELEKRTGESFGNDKAAWEAWWNGNNKL